MPRLYRSHRFLAYSFCLGMSATGLVAMTAQSSSAQSGPTFTSDLDTNDGGSINISTFLGAATFYNAGYTGTRAVVSNIEGGLFYHYHDGLTSQTNQLNYAGPTLPTLGAGTGGQANAVNDPNLTNDPNWSLYDLHATAVAGIIAGAPAYSGDPQAGIAYGATLVGGAISSGWIGSPYSESFNVTDTSFISPYVQAMQGGINLNNGTIRMSNVINGSYGYVDATYANGGTGSSGTDPYTVALDALAKSSGATVVWAAGNSGYGNGNVNDPAAGYNGISVAALASAGSSTTHYTTVDGFSSGGPSDYLSPTGLLIQGVRATVDIAAPGDSINTMYYNGATGGNLGASVPSSISTSSYGGFSAGTSFAAPIVAGAASLIDDVGYDRFGGGDSVNGTVVKAVLMNSANRLSTWNNGQTTINGVITTTQALDYSVGSGDLNIGASYTQYTANAATDDISHGKTISGPVVVGAVGWDYGNLNPALTGNYANTYLFGTSLVGGTTMSVTLTWDIDDSYNGLIGSDPDTATISSSELRFTNLDLEVFEITNGVSSLIAISEAQYITTQELSFFLPDTGAYYMQVLWAGDQYNLNNSDAEGQQYGIAWSATSSGISVAASAPEPSAVALVGLGGGAGFAAIGIARRRRQR